MAWRSGKFACVRITFVTRLKKSLRRPRRPHHVLKNFRGRSANAMRERVGVTGALGYNKFVYFTVVDRSTQGYFTHTDSSPIVGEGL